MINEAVQLRVEKTLSFVPDGNVISYGLLADLCGLPGRARMMGKCLQKSKRTVTGTEFFVLTAKSHCLAALTKHANSGSD